MAVPSIRLYQFAPDFGSESASPFCIKVHRALRLKGLAYEVKNVAPPQISKISPRTKKLPVLEVDGRTASDSTRILELIDRLEPDPPLYPESVELRALNHLLEDWADESLYWFTVYQRWVVDAHFEKFAEGAFHRMAAPMRWIVPTVARRMAREQTRMQGIGRLEPSEVLHRLGEHLDALNARLAAGAFMIDDRIRSSDLATFAVLRSLCSPYMEEPRSMVFERASLSAWMSRVDGVTRPDKAEAVAA